MVGECGRCWIIGNGTTCVTNIQKLTYVKVKYECYESFASANGLFVGSMPITCVFLMTSLCFPFPSLPFISAPSLSFLLFPSLCFFPSVSVALCIPSRSSHHFVRFHSIHPFRFLCPPLGPGYLDKTLFLFPAGPALILFALFVIFLMLRFVTLCLSLPFQLLV